MKKFNEELLKEREPMVLKELVTDSIYNIKEMIGELNNIELEKDKVKYLEDIKSILENVYRDIDSNDISNLKKESKEVLYMLLKERVEETKEAVVNTKEDEFEGITLFINYEYERLLSKFSKELSQKEGKYTLK